MADMLYLCIKDSKDIYKCGSFELYVKNVSQFP